MNIAKTIMHSVHKHKHERESFRARMQMEANEQKRIDRRLTSIEISYRNQGRIK